MNTPYQAPRSELQDESFNTPSPRKFWKFFFWLLLVLEIVSIGMMIDDQESWVEILVDVFIYTFVLTALFGYAYRKRILARTVWRLTIPIALIYDIHSLVTLDFEDIESTTELLVLSSITFAVMAPLVFAQYLGLFKYAYRSAEIWQ